jgi:hypothetical protein
LGEGAVAAEMALQAGDVMVQSDAVADFEAAQETARGESLRTATSPTGADFHNRAGGFVAEDARGRDGAVLDFFDVGGADAADGDFDEEFVRADARDGNGFEAEVVDDAINDGAHGFRDVEHPQFLTQRREDAKPQRTGFLSALKNFAPLR